MGQKQVVSMWTQGFFLVLLQALKHLFKILHKIRIGLLLILDRKRWLLKSFLKLYIEQKA